MQKNALKMQRMQILVNYADLHHRILSDALLNGNCLNVQETKMSTFLCNLKKPTKIEYQKGDGWRGLSWLTSSGALWGAVVGPYGVEAD